MCAAPLQDGQVRPRGVRKADVLQPQLAGHAGRLVAAVGCIHPGTALDDAQQAPHGHAAALEVDCFWHACRGKRMQARCMWFRKQCSHIYLFFLLKANVGAALDGGQQALHGHAAALDADC